jgi:hypothetical protein
MAVRSTISKIGAALVVGVMVLSGVVVAQTQPQQSLGSVRVPQRVMANGEPLAAGTYTLRVSNEKVAPVVGQSPEGETWVEFVQGGQVRGRELASVVPAADVKAVAEGSLPAPGTARVEMLKGAEYVRIWINRAGTHYLVHLSIAAK